MRQLTKNERFRLLDIAEEGGDHTAMVTSEEYHQLFFHYNWDGGVEVPQWIVEQKNCDLGTASKIFWYASPIYFTKYRSRDEAHDYEKPVFDLLQFIIARVQANGYHRQNIRFDPKSDDGGEPEAGPTIDLTEKYDITKAQWRIPDPLLKPTPGESVTRQELVMVTIRDLNASERQGTGAMIAHGIEVLRSCNVPHVDSAVPAFIVQGIEQLVNEIHMGKWPNLRNDDAHSLGWVWADQLRREYGWEWKCRDAEVETRVGIFAPEGNWVSYPPNLIRYLVQVPSAPNKVGSLFRQLARCERPQDFAEALGSGWLSLL